ncbi:VOC family protein [Microbaculum sp. FT89]|uniref:VOC family protein n=1 Tax=Microbaculum sp. FT89 TaxID=3447298 RepID=UPI003F52928A
MLDHVSITVSSIDRAESFYDAVFGALGVPKVVSEPNRLGYGQRAGADHPDRTYLSIRVGEAGRVQGRHWAFKAGSRADVDAFHAAGLAAGGRDEGAPGLRPHYHESYYAAFLRDPDGNRIEAVCHLPD